MMKAQITNVDVNWVDVSGWEDREPKLIPGTIGVSLTMTKSTATLQQLNEWLETHQEFELTEAT